MKTVELFCGTKSFSKIMAKHGHSTFAVDIESKFSPDLLGGVESLKKEDLPMDIDILWASPPCTTFSVASISHYWIAGKPKNEKTLYGTMLLEKTIQLIKEVKPKYWFIENPRGMMRKIIDDLFVKHGVSEYNRHTVSYCQYGAKIMKPTDIWTNCKEWTSKPICKPGASCHQRAGRGAKTGVQGIYSIEWERARGGSATARGIIPEKLFEEILNQLSNSL